MKKHSVDTSLTWSFQWNKQNL